MRINEVVASFIAPHDMMLCTYKAGKVMERKISTKKYFLAFLLTVIVFVIGILLGSLFENARLNYSEQVILREKVDLRSLQLQLKYIDSGQANCTVLKGILETNIDELGRKMAEVISYKKRAVFNQEEFDLQLQDYFLTEIQYLIISEEIDKECKKNSINIIYFYDENTDSTQGNILDYMKKLFGDNVLVFSFDSNFQQEPMIKILLDAKDIRKFPAVVVEDKVFQGYTSAKELMTTICTEFDQIHIDNSDCQKFMENKNNSSQ